MSTATSKTALDALRELVDTIDKCYTAATFNDVLANARRVIAREDEVPITREEVGERVRENLAARGFSHDVQQRAAVQAMSDYDFLHARKEEKPGDGQG